MEQPNNNITYARGHSNARRWTCPSFWGERALLFLFRNTTARGMDTIRKAVGLPTSEEPSVLGAAMADDIAFGLKRVFLHR